MPSAKQYALLNICYNVFLIIMGRFLLDVKAVAAYLRAVVDNDTVAQSHSCLDAQMVLECNSAALILREAKNHPSERNFVFHCPMHDFRAYNTVRVKWSAADYAEALPPRAHGRNEKLENTLEERFPPLFTGHLPTFTTPHVVTDCAGRLMVWYLPQVLTRFRRV